MKPTILTFTGQYFDFLKPEEYKLNIRDIGHGLSNVCRYTGQCIQFYSVAQHAVLVSLMVPAWYARCGLHHDDAEALLGDVSTPLKRLLPEYKVIEGRTEDSLRRQLDLPLEFHSCVKVADLRMLMTEKRDNLNVSPAGMNWLVSEVEYPPYDFILKPMLPKEAEEYYLDRHHQLQQLHAQGECL